VSIHITEQDSKKTVCCKSDGMRFAGADTTVKLRQDMSYIISITTVPAVAIRYRQTLHDSPTHYYTSTAADVEPNQQWRAAHKPQIVFVGVVQLHSLHVWAQFTNQCVALLAAA
jgi:hypothetical protein